VYNGFPGVTGRLRGNARRDGAARVRHAAAATVAIATVSPADVIVIATRLPAALAGGPPRRQDGTVPLHLAPNLDHGWRVGDRPGLLHLTALGGRGWASGRPASPARGGGMSSRRGDVRGERAAPASDVELPAPFQAANRAAHR
jgi:hypothetical protein